MKIEDRRSEDREVNQARSKPDTVDRCGWMDVEKTRESVLSDLCVSVATVSGQQHLLYNQWVLQWCISATNSGNDGTAPFLRRRPTVWNGLPAAQQTLDFVLRFSRIRAQNTLTTDGSWRYYLAIECGVKLECLRGERHWQT